MPPGRRLSPSPSASYAGAMRGIGAAFTAVLFEIGKLLLGICLGRESAASTYGAAGAVLLVLLWVYYTALVLLTGACFTRAYRDRATASGDARWPARN